MSRLLLVRHGETVWHAENRYAGRTDIDLTDNGRAQAERLARWVRTANLEAVWSSPLRRARLTALPSALAAGLPLQIDERLIELDFGQGEGLTDAEMEMHFRAERSAFRLDPVAHHLPGGEDPEQAAARGTAALYEIAAAVEGRGLVVAHSTLLRLSLCHLLGIPLPRYRSVFPHLANGALTEIQITPGAIGLLSFNNPLIDEHPEV